MSCNPSFPCLLLLYDTPAWRLMELYSIQRISPLQFYCLPKPLFRFDGTIIDISTILLTISYNCYSVHVFVMIGGFTIGEPGQIPWSGYIASVLFLLFFWCPCMAINVSVQYNGGLPDIILLAQCYFHRGTRLNVMKRFCICRL